MSRRSGFFIAILLGLATGLLYGWVINPVKYVDASPDSLREDYKVDYVLMAAEAFHADGNLDLAARRLALLGDQPPAQIASRAQLAARREGFPAGDQEMLDALVAALRVFTPVPATVNPGPRGTP